VIPTVIFEAGNAHVDMWNAGDVPEVGMNGPSSDAVAVAPEGVVNGNVVGPGAAAADLCVENRGVITGGVDRDFWSMEVPHGISSKDTARS
jgi:hypothetical protein